MFARLHQDQAGKFNVVHVLLLIVVSAALYASIMYIPAYLQFWKIKQAAQELALTGSTIERNDERNKSWYDSRMKEINVQYPMSEHLTYRRLDYENVEVAFEYDYPIKHFWSDQPHVLHFTFMCFAQNGHCNN